MKITATNSGDDNVAERNGWRTTKGSTIEGMCGMGGDKIQWVPFDLDRWIKWNQPHKLVVLWLDIINGTTSNPKSCLCCSLEGVKFLRIIFLKLFKLIVKYIYF